MTEHDRFQEMIGAYVLGALETAERHELEAHLESCERCRTEVSSMAPIPGLLRRIDGVTTASLPPAVVEETATRASAEWRALLGSRSRWRWTAVAAMVVIAALALSTLRANEDPADLVLAAGNGPVTGEVAMDGRTWGTALELELEGLPARERYVAWVVDGDGLWEQAATWGPTPSGRARLSGAAAAAVDDVEAIVITDADGIEIVSFVIGG